MQRAAESAVDVPGGGAPRVRLSLLRQRSGSSSAYRVRHARVDEPAERIAVADIVAADEVVRRGRVVRVRRIPVEKVLGADSELERLHSRVEQLPVDGLVGRYEPRRQGDAGGRIVVALLVV